MMAELGITPVAECVERKKEHETLCELGFRMAQGFFYGKPASLPDCLEWLTHNASFSPSVPQPPTTEGPMIQSFLEPRRPEPKVQKVYKDADWLLLQPSSQYTIQVLSAISQERAEAHVAKQENPEDFAIFCKPGKTRMLYIVVYGVFEDRDTAKEAASKLTSLAVSPWIRMLSGVQTEIRGKG